MAEKDKDERQEKERKRKTRVFGFRLNPELERVFLKVCKESKQPPYHVARLAIIEMIRRCDKHGFVEQARNGNIKKLSKATA